MPGNPLSDPNWANDLTDQIDKYVGMVRRGATDRIVLIVRAVVFGLVIAIAGIAVMVLGIILSGKLVQALLGEWGAERDTAVWISYLILAVIFFVGGTLAMRMRRPTPDVPAK